MKILSDNGTEFKNKIFEQVTKELGLEYKLYTPPVSPSFQWQDRGIPCFP